MTSDAPFLPYAYVIIFILCQSFKSGLFVLWDSAVQAGTKYVICLPQPSGGRKVEIVGVHHHIQLLIYQL